MKRFLVLLTVLLSINNKISAQANLKYLEKFAFCRYYDELENGMRDIKFSLDSVMKKSSESKCIQYYVFSRIESGYYNYLYVGAKCNKEFNSVELVRLATHDEDTYFNIKNELIEKNPKYISQVVDGNSVATKYERSNFTYVFTNGETDYKNSSKIYFIDVWYTYP